MQTTGPGNETSAVWRPPIVKMRNKSWLVATAVQVVPTATAYIMKISLNSVYTLPNRQVKHLLQKNRNG